MSVFEDVRSIVCEILGVEPDRVELETSLMNDLQANSLDVVEIVTTLEDKFNLNIIEDDLMDLDTVKDVVDYLEKTLKIEA
jgi:acyl carrier protein